MALHKSSSSHSSHVSAKEGTATMDPPTELARCVPGQLSTSTILVIVSEAWERCAYYGTGVMFTIYLETVLGRSKSQAVAIGRATQFVSFLTPVLGAVVADQWLGRFTAILAFAAIYPVGLVLLAISSTKFSVDGGFAMAGFCIGVFVFIAFGAGGIKGNISSFMAEQIEPGVRATATPGVYEDSRLTTERGFHYYYFAICVGTLVGIIVCPQVAKHTSYTLAFATAIIFFVTAGMVFVSGTRRYTRRKPQGSALPKAWHCMRYAWKHGHSGQKHWLDGALGADGQAWDDEFVLGLQSSLQACKVFLFYPVYWMLDFNVADTFINQGLTMRRPEWLSADQLNVVYNLALIAGIPACDLFIFPLLRRMGLRLGPVARIAIGFAIVVCALAYAAILQKVIYTRAPYYDFNGPNVPTGSTNDISIWHQAVPYSLIGISEIFTSVAGLEFAFTQAPEELRSILTALNLATICGGTLGGIIVSPWSKDPYVVYVFAGEAALLGVMTVVFYTCFRHYDGAAAEQ
ncbi:hypothetical protein LPJ61_004728 [Coemansia biformis]|uniref:PTR2-domain-containing protein n=1 Tax=Coemansia biformis TaxID=1286918 RepID=A0A9W7Y818_9FUNG|nr:hypothetical protein LPJ61_004728 [Coemansia biformis]